ncbi:MAG: hypothetical protein ACRC1K_12755 [Planctomycetia bacterium]
MHRPDWHAAQVTHAAIESQRAAGSPTAIGDHLLQWGGGGVQSEEEQVAVLGAYVDGLPPAQ